MIYYYDFVPLMVKLFCKDTIFFKIINIFVKPNDHGSEAESQWLSAIAKRRKHRLPVLRPEWSP